MAQNKITSSQIKDINATQVTGVLAVDQGGTGKSSFATGYVKSDGTQLLSSSLISGSEITGDITGKASNVTGIVAIANGGTGVSTISAGYVKSDGSAFTSTSSISGSDVTGDIVGRASNVTGVVAILNGGTGQTSFTSGYIKSDGTTLSSIAAIQGSDVSGDITGKASNVTGVVAIANGGTGLSSYSVGDLLYASSNDVLGKLAKGTDGQVLTVSNDTISWGPAPLNVDDLPVASTTTLGVVKVDGSSIVINDQGVISSVASATGNYDIVFSIPGYVGAGTIFVMVANRQFNLLASLPLAAVACMTKPTNNTTITINKKSGNTDTQLGTILMTSSSYSGTFTFTSDVTFNVGDILYFAVDIPDLTLANLSITVAGELL